MTAERLLARRHVVLVLRLVVDDHGRLAHGVAVDLAGRSTRTFHAWNDLSAVARPRPSQRPIPAHSTGLDRGTAACRRRRPMTDSRPWHASDPGPVLDG